MTERGEARSAGLRLVIALSVAAALGVLAVLLWPELTAMLRPDAEPPDPLPRRWDPEAVSPEPDPAPAPQQPLPQDGPSQQAPSSPEPPPEDTSPVVAEYVAPVVTDALRPHTPGRVFVLLMVGADGKVEQARVQSSTHPALEGPTLEAVRHWRFEPGRRGGKPTPYRLRLPVVFEDMNVADAPAGS